MSYERWDAFRGWLSRLTGRSASARFTYSACQLRRGAPDGSRPLWKSFHKGVRPLCGNFIQTPSTECLFALPLLHPLHESRKFLWIETVKYLEQRSGLLDSLTDCLASVELILRRGKGEQVFGQRRAWLLS